MVSEIVITGIAVPVGALVLIAICVCCICRRRRATRGIVHNTGNVGILQSSVGSSIVSSVSAGTGIIKVHHIPATPSTSVGDASYLGSPPPYSEFPVSNSLPATVPSANHDAFSNPTVINDRQISDFNADGYTRLDPALHGRPSNQSHISKHRAEQVRTQPKQPNPGYQNITNELLSHQDSTPWAHRNEREGHNQEIMNSFSNSFDVDSSSGYLQPTFVNDRNDGYLQPINSIINARNDVESGYVEPDRETVYDYIE